MIEEDIVLRKIHAAIEVEPRIKLHTDPLHVEFRDSHLLLDGSVGSVAAKRLAVRLARQIEGVDGVIDHLEVATAEACADGEILESYTQLVLGQIDLKNCSFSRNNRGRTELLHEVLADDSCGAIAFSVENGTVVLEGHVISLSHRRIAEVLAWWVPGCRNVVNRIEVIPAEGDSDDEVSDAVRLALEMDPLIAHADQIGVSTCIGIVALQGAIGSEEERQMAEFDAWCIPGVNDVDNRLEITK